LCTLYQSAPQLKEKGIHLVSCDEKTGMQAIERMSTPMKRGQAERMETNYIRHGTQCLIANFEVATGKIVSPTIGDTRKEEDFTTHIKKTVDTSPDDKWIFIVDQLNTHKSSSLVEYVAHVCGYTESLGEKGKSGILKDMESRAKFLSDATHAIQFVYTPKHASWLNQVEVWFSILSRKLLKRLSSCSTDELKNKVSQFIDYFNLTAAKAFKWTYKGRPLSK